jgi:hypothetical protein
MEGSKQGNEKKKAEDGREERKKSQIWYFDIFYVDLDRAKQNSTGVSFPSISPSPRHHISWSNFS